MHALVMSISSYIIEPSLNSLHRMSYTMRSLEETSAFSLTQYLAAEILVLPHSRDATAFPSFPGPHSFLSHERFRCLLYDERRDLAHSH